MGKFKFTMGSGGIHNITERSPEHVAERKRLSALRRDVRRKLKKNERLTGDVLECALNTADEKLAEKLKKGEVLDNFEKQLIAEMMNQGANSVNENISSSDQELA
jgi:hypothetical protein